MTRNADDLPEFEACPNCEETMLNPTFCDDCGWPHFHEMDNELLRYMINSRREKYKTNKLTRRIVIEIAEHFNVPPMDMVQELETRGIARSGSVDWFKENGGITNDHIEQAKQGVLLL